MDLEESVIAYLKHHLESFNRTGIVGFALYYTKDEIKYKYECLPTKRYNKKTKKEAKGYIDVWTPGWGFQSSHQFNESFNGMVYKDLGIGA